jgi:uncharacterized membrane protein YeaQ/YmgE (transglycosylase-associated protein family)
MKPGAKTSEFFTSIAGMVAVVIPVVMDKVPPGSVTYVILGAVGAAAAYIAGRTYLKAVTVKAEATKAIAESVKGQAAALVP